MCYSIITTRQQKDRAMTQTATLTFQSREQAEQFASAWVRNTFTGHVINAGSENVSVKVYDLNDDKKAWIEAYVEKING